MTTADSAIGTATGEILKRDFEGFSGSTLEERVRELVDREEIRELAARYAQRLSRRQSMADMFTDDGAVIIRRPDAEVQEVRGREQIGQTFAAAIANPMLSMSTVHNHVISISGNEATATSWNEVYVSDDQERTFAGCNYYNDRLRRDNGRWKFAVREVRVVIVGPAQRVSDAAPDDPP
jgi:hypothetical protein